MSRDLRALVGLAALVLLILISAPFIGQVDVPFAALFDPSGDTLGARVLWHLRLPRVAIAALVGAALATAGAAFQAFFRNPLATPYTLGLASGATFAVALISVGHFAASLLLPLSTIAALGGASVAAILVWFLGAGRQRLDPPTLLLAGVAVSFFFSAGVLLVELAASPGDAWKIVRWLMGGLGGADSQSLLVAAPMIAVGLAMIAWQHRELDLLSLGESVASSRGVDTTSARRRTFLAATLLVAASVAVAGPIGFVGLVVPHLVRLALGPRHSVLLPASMLAGAGFLVLADTVARLILAPAELPVGVLTALLGGPFLLWLLHRRGRRAW